jgi:hypothetical protein
LLVHHRDKVVLVFALAVFVVATIHGGFGLDGGVGMASKVPVGAASSRGGHVVESRVAHGESRRVRSRFASKGRTERERVVVDSGVGIVGCYSPKSRYGDEPLLVGVVGYRIKSKRCYTLRKGKTILWQWPGSRESVFRLEIKY